MNCVLDGDGMDGKLSEGGVVGGVVDGVSWVGLLGDRAGDGWADGTEMEVFCVEVLDGDEGDGEFCHTMVMLV